MEPFIIGRREDEIRILTPFRLIFDYFRFAYVLLSNRPELVHLNPSLTFKSVWREAIFILIAKLFGVSVLVFFRGWKYEFIENPNRISFGLFRWIYGKVDQFIVLGEVFREELRQWFPRIPIEVETTTVDNKLVEGVRVEEAIELRLNSGAVTLLFLSRIVREKGIFDLLEAYRRLRKSSRRYQLHIAGDGPDHEELREIADGIPGITFHGYVSGEAKKSCFMEAGVFCLPTYYGEGLPTVLLEAMAFGLPLVTTRVGGIPDVVEDGENGSFVSPRDPRGIVQAVTQLVDDQTSYKQISQRNAGLARQRFLAEKVAQRLRSIYDRILKDA